MKTKLLTSEKIKLQIKARQAELKKVKARLAAAKEKYEALEDLKISIGGGEDCWGEIRMLKIQLEDAKKREAAEAAAYLQRVK